MAFTKLETNVLLLLCVLQYPTDGASTEDEIVAEFCKEQLYGDSMKEAYIELPD